MVKIFQNTRKLAQFRKNYQKTSKQQKLLEKLAKYRNR